MQGVGEARAERAGPGPPGPSRGRPRRSRHHCPVSQQWAQGGQRNTVSPASPKQTAFLEDFLFSFLIMHFLGIPHGEVEAFPSI